MVKLTKEEIDKMYNLSFSNTETFEENFRESNKLERELARKYNVTTTDIYEAYYYQSRQY